MALALNKVVRTDSKIRFPTANEEEKSINYSPSPIWDKLTNLSKKAVDLQKISYNPRPLPYSVATDHPLAACLRAPRLTATCLQEDAQTINYLSTISQDEIREEWTTRSTLHSAVLTERGTSTIQDLLHAFSKITEIQEIKGMPGLEIKTEIQMIKGYCSAVVNPQEETIMALGMELQRKRIKIRENVTKNIRNKSARSALLGGEIFTKDIFDPAQVKIAKEILNSNQTLASSIAASNREKKPFVSTKNYLPPHQQRKRPHPGPPRPQQMPTGHPSTSRHQTFNRTQNPGPAYQPPPSTRPQQPYRPNNSGGDRKPYTKPKQTFRGGKRGGGSDYLPRRLSSRIQQWPPGRIREAIRKGITWRWYAHPPKLCLPPPSTVLRVKITWPLVHKLIQLGAVKQIPVAPCFPSTVFPVLKSSGGHRLVINLSNLNRFIPCPSFKMADTPKLRNTLPRGAWFTTIDLSNAFLHVPVHHMFRKFLCFSHNEKLYQYQTTPFGLNISPRWFTKVSEIPLRILRERKVTTSVYLDDWLTWGKTREECLQNTKQVMSVLSKLGFDINLRKSVLEPTQTIIYLGVVWNGEFSTVSPALKTVKQTRHCLNLALHKSRLSTKSYQRLLGLLNFLRPLSRGLLSLFSELCLQKRLAKLVAPRLTPGLKLTLSKILNSLRVILPVPMRPQATSLHIWTDASQDGWGAATSTSRTISKKWRKSQSSLHITAKESLAVLLALRTIKPKPYSTIRLNTDCSTTVSWVQHLGSKTSTLLMRLGKQLAQFLTHYHLHLHAQHVPGINNMWADSLSRSLPNPLEWTLTKLTFSRIIKMHGPLQVDLFAHPGNAHLPLFVTPLDYPTAIATDAMSTNWNKWKQIYLFPPEPLLDKIQDLLPRFRGHGVIILPHRPLAKWWTNITKGKKKLPITLHLYQRTLEGIIKRPSSAAPLFHAWSF
jgi:hypothetical protein